MPPLTLDPDRLFPSDEPTRAIARELFAEVRDLPLVCPHGHVDVNVLADDEPFGDPAQLLVIPDHYVLRMLYSQGLSFEELGVPDRDGKVGQSDPREVWRRLAENWHLFRATPSRLWMEQELHDLFGVRERLGPQTADAIYDQISECLKRDEFRPRALYDRFNIEVLTTTDSPLDSLEPHQRIADSDWRGRVLPTFRPDALVDVEAAGWRAGVEALGELTDQDTTGYAGYLAALEARRAHFVAHGATATDHGHRTAATGWLTATEAQELYVRAIKGDIDPADAERFRGHMLMEMARMSAEDGLVMQLHIGSHRDHNQALYERYGPDQGADIPQPTDFVKGLEPLVNAFGSSPGLRIVLFTLDETTYSRELAPLAGHYPALRLGPPWWFYDSPDGIRRYRELVTETAGFYNTAGFNDDTRAFCSIPARHDVARRLDVGFLAGLVREGRLPLDEAHEVAVDLAYHLAKQTYRL